MSIIAPIRTAARTAIPHALRGANDGPNVIRTIVSKAVLEADPRLLGKLDPPLGGILPKGVAMRVADDGTRVMTVNVHMSVPAYQSLNDLGNESIDGLRDVARFINSSNPDVVLVQELRSRPIEAARANGGLPDSASILAHLMQADDMAFTPALRQDPFSTPLEHYGTAVYTRNGFRIDKSVNAVLPTSTPDVELRSIGLNAIIPPDERKPFSLMSTHLASEERTDRLLKLPGHTSGELSEALRTDQALRDAQLGVVGGWADNLATGRPFSVEAAITGEQQLVKGFPAGRVVVGGDFNQHQRVTDPLLNPLGLTHVNDLFERSGRATAQELHDIDQATSLIELIPSGRPHRIDHLYGRGMESTNVSVGAAPKVESVLEPTDHSAVIADLV
ncbi:MAG: hypothetical protein JWM90_1107 [Thermoleophilia bacterium]|nr:hypothetical protein [Thermoleophilia bacterium]